MSELFSNCCKNYKEMYLNLEADHDAVLKENFSLKVENERLKKEY